ncbi:MAG: hypothetical protein F6K18_13640 [Okeania sp. SIO2C2]|uniref:hypothetical protein n=1 Tax=Okeania sp. SIO2C2 TaxID=2607787 RepID=UPI0013B9C2F8|nr:hypothetical protein [Okeania sp. SIO2C2]NEP87775.1 hypothetical protein [Okeania sp. SIO2C2]
MLKKSFSEESSQDYYTTYLAQNPRFLNWNYLKAGTPLVPAKAETFASKNF